MQIGELYLYKENKGSQPRVVLVTDGTYSVDGRVSNFWNFTYLLKDGRLSTKTGGDYDNEMWKFKRVPKSWYTSCYHFHKPGVLYKDSRYVSWVKKIAKGYRDSSRPFSKIMLAESLASKFNLSPKYAKEIAETIYK